MPLIVPGETRTKRRIFFEYQKILLLTMKCAEDMNDALIGRISSRLGTNSLIIFHLVEILRTAMRTRTRRLRQLAERRRKVIFRIRFLQDMRENSRDVFYAERLDGKIRREQERLENIHKALSITPRGPSHTVISRILGIPKGTVDSGMYYMRSVMKKKYPQ